MSCQNQTPLMPTLCGITSNHSWGEPLQNPINIYSYLGTADPVISIVDVNTFSIKDPYNNWRVYDKFYDTAYPDQISRRKIRFLACTRFWDRYDYQIELDVNAQIHSTNQSLLLITHNGTIAADLINHWLTVKAPSIRLTHSIESYQATCLEFGYRIQGSSVIKPCCMPEDENPPTDDPVNPDPGGCTKVLTASLSTENCQFTSTISQEDANNKARAYLKSRRQELLNSLQCQDICVTMTDMKTRNNCPEGSTGTEPPTPYSTTKCAPTRAQAESLALSDIATNSQDWANTWGQCLQNPPNNCGKTVGLVIAPYFIVAFKGSGKSKTEIAQQLYSVKYYPHKITYPGGVLGGYSNQINGTTSDKVWGSCLAKAGTLNYILQIGNTYGSNGGQQLAVAANLKYRISFFFYDITGGGESGAFHSEEREAYYNTAFNTFSITVPSSPFTNSALGVQVDLLQNPTTVNLGSEALSYSSVLTLNRSDCC